MRTIIWFIYFWLYIIAVLPRMFHAKSLARSGNQEKLLEYVNPEVQKWAKSLMKVAGCKVEVSGLENIPKNRAAVFISNHQSNWDIPIILSQLDKPHGMVAKVELEKLPIIPTWMRFFGCTFIDRNNARQSIKALNEAGEKLKEGTSIVIFPEGTRSKGEEIGEFKSGAFKMAFKNNAPIIPISIDGSYKIMEQQGGWIKPGTVKLTVLPPIETKGMDKQRQSTLGDEIKEMILSTRDPR